MRYIEGVSRNQILLFPEVVDDYIEDDNPVRFIDIFVDSLNMKELGFKYAETKETGRPPYNPRDMLKLYLYGYLNRIRSSRRLEKETHRNLEMMWLLNKLTPDFKTIADFRKDNHSAIKKICKEFIFLCKSLELFGCELIAIDGSKFKAVNSKKRNFNEKKLQKKLRELDEKIEEYLRELDENDEREDSEKPFKVGVKEKVEEFKRRSEEYTKLLENLMESEETQVSLTDPDARAMVNNQRIEPCYNVQFTIDSKNKLILDYEVTNDIKDGEHLSDMAKRAKEILEVEEIEVLADKGYYDSQEIKECVDNGIKVYIPEPDSTVSKEVDIPKPEFYKDKFQYNREKDVYVCPEGKELTYRNRAVHHGKDMMIYKSKECLSCAKIKLCTRNKNGRIIYRWEHEEVLEDMRERVRKEKEKVKLRNLLTEHIFGTIKRNFNQGYMLLKRKEKVSVEMSLTVLAYNITRVLNIVGIDRLKSAISSGKNFKNKIINDGKKKILILLNFLKKKLNKIISLRRIETPGFKFSHSLTLGVLMNKLILLIFFLSLESLLCQPLNAASFRPSAGVGYTTSYGKGIAGLGYHIGGRFLLEANPNQKYGLEITYIRAVASESRDYVAMGIVLEQRKFNWFNMSIGTIGYINIRESTYPFGIVTNLGWEPRASGRLKPFVTYRSEWIFDKVFLGINSISIGTTF